jgi:transketolase
MSIAPDFDPAVAASGPRVASSPGRPRLRVVDDETSIPEADGTALLAPALRAWLAAERPASACAGIGVLQAAVALVADHLLFDAADPGWPDRDRLLASADLQDLLDGIFALSASAGCAASPAETRAPRPARPTGLGAAVGMALAERVLAARFGRSLVDHRTWLLAGPAELSDGASHEAASLAGEWKLERLTVLAAYGWATRIVDPADSVALSAGFGTAKRARKPTLLACRAERPEAPPPAVIDEAMLAAWRALGTAHASTRRGWLKRFAHHPRRAEFERVRAGTAPDGLDATFERLREAFVAAHEPLPTSTVSERILQALLAAVPELAVGTADIRPAPPQGAVPLVSGAAGRWLRAGPREQGLAAAMDGMAAHGGLLPIGVTVCALGEALRPALWRAASLGLRVVHVLTCAAGEPGDPTDVRTADQLASLRAAPNLLVLHPADALETLECWEVALRRNDGPSLLVLSREARPPLRAICDRNCSERGGYVLAEAQGPRRAALIAAGSAVALAMTVRARLAAERIYVAVVSLPCWALFARADAEYRAQVLGDAPRFGIEPGGGFGWERWLGERGTFIGAASEGGPAPLSADAIAGLIRERLSH